MTTLKRILAIGILMSLALPGFGQEGSVAVIDLDRTFNEYYKTKLADAELKEQAEEFNRERKSLVEEYDALEVSFNAAREEAQNRALSDEVRDARRNEAEEKLLELREYEDKIRRFDQSRKKELDEQSKRMRGRLVKEISDKLETYAVSRGYSLVIDYSGQSLNGVPVVMYSDGKMDITDDVVTLINEEEK